MSSPVPVTTRAAIEHIFGDCEIRVIRQRELERGRVSVCDVKYERRVQSRSESVERSRTIRYRHRLLLWEADDGMRFPSFNVQPKVNSALVTTVNSLARMFGGGQFHDLSFPDDREFGAKLTVGTAEPDAVRGMLTPALRDILKDHIDLTSTLDRNVIVVQSDGESGDDVEDWESFEERAAKVASAFIDAEQKTRSERKAARQDGGTTADELERWLQLPTPRPLLDSLRNRYTPTDTFLSMWSILMGGMASLVGTVFLFAPNLKWIGLLVLTVGLSLSLVWPTIRWCLSRRKFQLLSHGTLVNAVVSDVKPTTRVLINGSQRFRRYLVTYSWKSGGDEQTVTSSVYGADVYPLSRLAAAGRETRILIDPVHPKRVLWIESAIREGTS